METKNEGGFIKNVTFVEGADKYQGITVRITSLNENYVVEKVNSEEIVEDIVATIPDVITVVNLEASMWC